MRVKYEKMKMVKLIKLLCEVLANVKMSGRMKCECVWWYGERVRMRVRMIENEIEKWV